MKGRLRGKYQKKQQSTSIFFLLWSAFALVSFVILLLFAVTQNFVIERTYKAEAARTVNVHGAQVERALRSPIPDDFAGDYGDYVRVVAMRSEVEVFILDGEGTVLYPVFPPDAEEDDGFLDFSDRVAELREKLDEAGATAENEKHVTYETENAYVYGGVLTETATERAYLYVYRSTAMMKAVVSQMRVRTLLMSLFVFVLSFVASSAISGLLSNPIREMTEKAKRFARGDFEVDFHGSDYASEMVELAETLNFTRDEVSKADKMQKELLANVSHDFKTPLTMIKAYASMILEISGDIPDKRNRDAQIIIDEADRLTSLVNDMLDLSKIRSGMATLQSNLFDLSAYVYDTVERFGYLVETQGYRFELDVEDGLYTVADELKIGQVLYNLIGNAVNYTGEDKRVQVVLKKKGESVYFAVTDSGKGIAKEELATIWERYYRSSEAHKRPVRGTGLGLSIVKTVLEKHGFQFGVESEIGKGSTFYVYFPLR